MFLLLFRADSKELSSQLFFGPNSTRFARSHFSAPKNLDFQGPPLPMPLVMDLARLKLFSIRSVRYRIENKVDAGNQYGTAIMLPSSYTGMLRYRAEMPGFKCRCQATVIAQKVYSIFNSVRYWNAQVPD